MAFEGLPDSWTVWADDGGRVVLAFRPDVFAGDDRDPAHLPTISVSTRPPDVPMRRGGDPASDWHVSCLLEPEVRVRALESSHATREEAVEASVEAARRFADGDVDFGAVYAVAPPERYLDRLRELTD